MHSDLRFPPAEVMFELSHLLFAVTTQTYLKSKTYHLDQVVTQLEHLEKQKQQAGHGDNDDEEEERGEHAGTA